MLLILKITLMVYELANYITFAHMRRTAMQSVIKGPIEAKAKWSHMCFFAMLAHNLFLKNRYFQSQLVNYQIPYN